MKMVSSIILSSALTIFVSLQRYINKILYYSESYVNNSLYCTKSYSKNVAMICMTAILWKFLVHNVLFV